MKYKIECKQKDGSTYSKMINVHNLKSAKLMLKAYKSEFYNCYDFKLIKVESSND